MSRTRLVAALAVVALGALGVWLLAFPLPNAIVLAAVPIVAVGARRLLVGPSAPRWHAPPEEKRHVGARREVARLAWSMQGSNEAVEHRSVIRLRNLAAARLARRGVHLDAAADEAACRAELGAAVLATLDSHPNSPPSFAAYAQAVAAVERLNPKEHAS